MATKVYCVRLKNRDELLKSSSGGAFTAMSDYFISYDNYVMCPVYDYGKQELQFRIFSNAKERDKARGSKYFASYIGTAFRDAIKLLLDNPTKKMLFVGMGCQAEGFRKLSETMGVRDRVYIVDIICTGNPSPKIWKSFILRYNNVSYVTFKDKRNGWYAPTAIAVANGEEVSIQDWLDIFYGHNADKPSCSLCPFARVSRSVDITIGDFWRIEKSLPDFFDPNGNSVVLIHTEKGIDLFNSIKTNVYFQESDIKACWQSRLYTPPGKPVTRNAFWRAYRRHGIEYVIKHYKEIPLWGKILAKANNGIRKIKNVLH